MNTSFEAWAKMHAVAKDRSGSAVLETFAKRLEFSDALASYVPCGFEYVELTYFGALESEPALKLLIQGQLAASVHVGSGEILIADLRVEPSGELASDAEALWTLSTGELTSYLAATPPNELIDTTGDGFVDIVRPWLLDTAADQPPRQQSVAADSFGSWVLVNGVDAGFQPAGLLAFREDVAEAFAELRPTFAMHRSQWWNDSVGWPMESESERDRALYSSQVARRDAFLGMLDSPAF